MNTVVFQSFRTSDVPRHILDCCSSVRSWAQSAGYSYQFFDDAFLELAPDWYRRKAGACLFVVTDLTRLIQAQRLLASGFDRVVWCDADMIVFRPDQLLLDPGWTGTYCTEAWMYKDEAGEPRVLQKVNNSMCVFTRAAVDHLAEYIAECCALVQRSPNIGTGLSVGTELLTARYRSRALIPTVGIVSPHLMEAILEGDEQMLTRYREWQGAPIYAANLCNSFRQAFANCPKLFDYLCAGVIDKLLCGVSGELLSRS